MHTRTVNSAVSISWIKQRNTPTELNCKEVTHLKVTAN